MHTTRKTTRNGLSRSLVLLVALLATTLASPLSQASALAYKDPTGDDVVAHVASPPAPVAMLKAPPTT